ncbi:hypothetical protein DPMN_050459 [Dreissena polymorpha]|uniref:Uncharacterized protein n=1 Tax=Dreissena polymorpha TaxID=45954 RepID=A0A9D4CGS2_DREPO|nr:hypothetical protein DPMN_050459 [Dreissena polymorpha]
MNKGKRSLSSKASEASTNTSLLETSVFEKSEFSAKSSNKTKSAKGKSKPDPKKQKTMSTFVTNTKNENRDSSELTIEKRLEEISSKLSNVLTKDDSIFIKDIIKETVEQLKEKLLGNVIRRIEILENDVFEQKREIEQLKKESESKSKQIEDLKSQNAALGNKQPCDTLNHEEFANNTEQYSRRNNIRIAGVPQDQDRQSWCL